MNLGEMSNVKREFKINQAISEYKNNIKYVSDKQIEFAESVVSKVFNNNNEKILVNHNRCGIGKSTIIKAVLNQLVNNYFYIGKRSRKDELDKFGAIVVTDKLERLEEIASYSGLEDRCYLMRYDKLEDDELYKNVRIEFLKQLNEQYKYPVVLISTQKYFKMKECERNRLYNWKNGKRSIKFIDEKPYIIDTEVIDEKYLSDIAIAIEALPKCKDKDYLLNYWRNIYGFIDNLRNSYTEYDLNWISGNGTESIINQTLDKEFFNILSKYVTSRVYDNIERLKNINKNGCLFVSSSDKYQDNTRKLILIKNNIDKFDTDKCKNIIFDATAKYDIDYTISDKFQLFKSDDSKEKDINIHHILTSTSQKMLTDNKHIEVIARYINTLDRNIFVATYSKKRGIYQELSKLLNTENIEYFGNIKGRNDWASISNMAQIGMNRKSNYIYLITYIALTNIDKNWNEIKDKNKISNEIKELIKNDKGEFKNDKMTRIMESDLTVDTIQNIMRIKCRHFSNKDICNVFILCSPYLRNVTKKVSDVVNADRKEYIPNIFEEEKLMNRKANDGKLKTNPQILLEYLKKLDKGRVISTKEIYNESGLNKSQFDKAKKDNPILKEWFIQHKSKRGEFIA